jgi:hypothetical protein
MTWTSAEDELNKIFPPSYFGNAHLKNMMYYPPIVLEPKKLTLALEQTGNDFKKQITINSKAWTFDSTKNESFFKKIKSSRKNNKFKYFVPFGFKSINIKTNEYNISKYLAYLMALSDLILGDEYFDWEKFKDFEVESGTLFYPPGDSDSNVTRIYAFPQLKKAFGGNSYPSSTYSELIQTPVSNIRNIGADFFGDENVIAVNDYLKTQAKQQKINKVIEYGIVESIADNIDGFVFLYGIFWKIKDKEDEFQTVQFEEFEDANAFTTLVFPKKYLKKSTDDFFNELFQKYTLRKEALDDVIQLQQKKETAATRGRDRGGLQGGGGVVQQ